jgi:hypothetical protein
MTKATVLYAAVSAFQPSGLALHRDSDEYYQQLEKGQTKRVRQ